MEAIGLKMDFKETELCLGLPGGGNNKKDEAAALELTPTPKASNKRGFCETAVIDLKLNLQSKESSVDLNENFKNPPSNNKNHDKDPAKPSANKAQVVGWPPVRSYRKNAMAETAAFVKVCMDGAPYLRKVDLKTYKSYQELSDALAKMFSSFTMGNYGSQGMIDFMNESKLMDLLNSSDYVPTYEDKDGDWMLVGDVPWEMFVDSCKRMRIMKGSEAIGLGMFSFVFVFVFHTIS
ncbi:hypothetical protein WN944_025864 [Citrus x changshan-huyou]